MSKHNNNLKDSSILKCKCGRRGSIGAEKMFYGGTYVCPDCQYREAEKRYKKYKNELRKTIKHILESVNDDIDNTLNQIAKNAEFGDVIKIEKDKWGLVIKCEDNIKKKDIFEALQNWINKSSANQAYAEAMFAKDEVRVLIKSAGSPRYHFFGTVPKKMYDAYCNLFKQSPKDPS